MRQARLLCVALFVVSLALGAASRTEAAAPPAAAPASCDPDATLRYVCGPVNAEDVLQLGNTRWIITSGMDGPLNGGGPARGHLYLIDHQAKTFIDWFPGANPVFNHDKSMFPDCPGPLDVTSFSAHGIALRDTGSGSHRVYVTGHGAREAIEIFEVDQTVEVRGSRNPGFVPPPPSITWVGCVVLPGKVSANSVATLDDGGFITTQFMDRSLPLVEAFGQVRQGKINGKVYEWHPGGKVQPIAGTEMSGPNGIVTTADGKTFFVASYGTNEVMRFERGTGALRRQVLKMDITPDNLRWTTEGKLLATGGNHAAPGTGTAPAQAGWSVVEIDPQTLAMRRVANVERTTGMAGATVGIRVGNEIWVGTYSGNRIGYLPVR